MTTAAPRSVLLVDDHQLVRDGLQLIIDASGDLRTCATAASAGEARRALDAHHPDVAVIDLSLGDGSDGLDLVKWLRAHHPATRAVVASMHDERLYGERALRAGASAYVSKSMPAKAVVDAIHAVCAGELYFSSTVVSAMLRRAGQPAGEGRSAMEQLSDRELQVFRAIGEGLASKEIAHRLSVSVSTVDTYRERLKTKLAIASSAELVNRATRWVLENR